MFVVTHAVRAADGVIEFHVSSSIADNAKNAEKRYFSTLQSALAAMQKLEPVQRNYPVVVYLGDEIYRFNTPWILSNEFYGEAINSHGITFKASPDAKPVISGAVRIGNWQLHDSDLKIYKADASTLNSRQLYVNGKRAVRARTGHNDGPLPAGFLPVAMQPSPMQRPYVMKGGIEYIASDLNNERWRDPTTWTNPKDVSAVIKTQWKMMSVPVESIAPPAEGRTKGMIKMQQPAWTNANLFFDKNQKAPGIWSFWQVTQFENAYEFLDEPGEWYLNKATQTLYYIPREGEDMTTADVEMPILETLLAAKGTKDNPVVNVTFEGITFAYATWHGPDSDNGYVVDQSGFHVVGDQNIPNYTGHVQPQIIQGKETIVGTPGNLKFEFAENIKFHKNRFLHMGAVALAFGEGSKNNTVTNNKFDDISSAALQIGGIMKDKGSSSLAENTYPVSTDVSNNTITRTGRDYVDSAAIFVGYSKKTTVSHNTISHVPWSGIAIGWGWGLLDKGMFPGIPNATAGMWGNYDQSISMSRNKIMHNKISNFLEDRWDGGAIYSTGQQGTSASAPLLIEGNVAFDKRAGAGGNTFYTDGGSRYITLKDNASYSNAIGHVDMGPPPQWGNPLPYDVAPSLLNSIPYGSDSGGCRTYGDIAYENNYWLEGKIPVKEFELDILSYIFTKGDLYLQHGFFDVCPFTYEGVKYPTGLSYSGNVQIENKAAIPASILGNAGVQ
jgi:hypothetical protein